MADPTSTEPGVPAAHLWPWAGWYAVVVDGAVAGVHHRSADAAAAVAAVPGQPSSVSVVRIGGADAVAAPPADGGTSAAPARRYPGPP